jgi:hypothetical protein
MVGFTTDVTCDGATRFTVLSQLVCMGIPQATMEDALIEAILECCQIFWLLRVGRVSVTTRRCLLGPAGAY